MYSGVLALLPSSGCTKSGQFFGSDFLALRFCRSTSCQRAQTLIFTTPRPRETRKRVDRAHTQIAMPLKSLLFALLLSDAASGKPRRLRGTSSDVNEGASSNITARAAVSNQFNPGPRPPTGSVTNPCRFPAASRAMNQNPDPDSNDPRVQGVPSPQVVL